MKLRHKKTGGIYELNDFCLYDGKGSAIRPFLKSLAELNEEWEDYEEPKKHYEILAMGAVMERENAEDEMFRNQEQREIGNYFETREEAEKAVEKLKALANLHKNGFRFIKWKGAGPLDELHYRFIIEAEAEGAAIDDLDLLFSGEDA